MNGHSAIVLHEHSVISCIKLTIRILNSSPGDLVFVCAVYEKQPVKEGMATSVGWVKYEDTIALLSEWKTSF